MVRELLSRSNRTETYAEAVGGTETEQQAVKQIRLPWHLIEPAGREKLETLRKICDEENKKLCALNHKNVIKFKSIYLDYETCCVMVHMTLLSSTAVTMERHIPEGGLSESRIRNLTRQMCDALSYLHGFETPIVHRNINCKTVLVCPGDHVVLINFGLAIQLLEPVTEHPSTGERGDPHFMAPEMFLCEETEEAPYSSRSDIWAFGCVIYQMLVGKRPHWECRNMLAIVRKVQRQRAPQLPDNCSEELRNFYECCTKKTASERTVAKELMKHPFIPQTEDPSRGSASCVTPAFESQDQGKHRIQTDGGHSRTKIDSDRQEVSTTSKEPASDTYPATASIPGLCLIISIDTYNDSSKSKQQNEVKNIKDTFINIGFKVHQCAANTKDVDFWHAINDIVRAEELNSVGSFVCFILGNGTGGSFFASDGKEIEVRDVVARFRASRCSGLKDKPKIFFIQTEKQPDSLQASSLEETSFWLHEKDEFLLCSAGSRASNGGSLADTVCAVIKDPKFSKQHIELMVAEVNKRLGLSEIKTRTEKFGIEASSVSSLTKNFFLKRPDFEDNISEYPEKWSNKQLSDQCNSVEDPVKTFGPKKQTLLMIASVRGRDDLVGSLLQKNLEPSIVFVQDVQGRTALSWAAINGHKDVLREFQTAFSANYDALKSGVNLADNINQTPLILAAKNDKTNVLEQLVEMGANIDGQDAMKYSALMHAAKLGFEATVRKLCDLGANPMLKDFNGNTAFIWAARCGKLRVLKVLRKALADLSQFSVKGERNLTALEWAKFSGHKNCQQFIDRILKAPRSEGDGDPVNVASDSGCGDQPSDEDNAHPRRQYNNGNDLHGERRGGGGGGPNNPGPFAYYSMRRRRRAIIVEILDFTQSTTPSLPQRQPADNQQLIRCFNQLGFDILFLRNITSNAFYNLLEYDRDQADYENEDAFLLCILSHGEQGYVYGADGSRVLLKKVYQQFRMCAALQNKPKIFIVQSSRGKAQPGALARSVGDLNSGQHEDCLYIHSVVKGNMCHGTYIDKLCHVILNVFDNEQDNLVSVLPRVARTSPENCVACYRSTLMKLLELPPLR